MTLETENVLHNAMHSNICQYKAQHVSH